MLNASRFALGLLLPLTLAACSTPSAPSAPAAFYGDGLDHRWTANADEGQKVLNSLTGGLKTQGINLGLSLSITASNGWGPIEVDQSNGETAPYDGHTLTLNGALYPNGLGVHGYSDIHIKANGLQTPACMHFKADVGIDDEVGRRGSATFQVFADGVKVFDSGVMTGASDTQYIDVPVGGKSDLRFVVDPGTDNYYDHADWAGARLECPTADDQGPAMFLVNPNPLVYSLGQSVYLSFALQDRASDFKLASGVKSVRIFRNDVLVGSTEPQEYAYGNAIKLSVPTADSANVSLTLPPQTEEGTFPIRVEAKDFAGNVGLGGATYQVRPPPVVTGYSPSSGPAGTRVTVQGQGFPAGQFSVNVGNADSIFINDDDVSADGTSFVFTIPSGTGTVPIELSGYFFSVSVGTFTYTSP